MNTYKHYIDCQIPTSDIPIIKEIIPNSQEAIPKQSCAIVIGASFAGLSTALLMSTHFDKVILLERSTYSSEESIVRNRQGRQAHVICNRSILVLDKMLPGFIQDLNEHVDEQVKKGFLRQKLLPSKNIKYSYFGDNVSDCSSFDGRNQFVLTRSQLEELLIKRIGKIGNIEIQYDTSVSKINTANGKVDSVTISKQNGKEDLKCQFLINCGGINSDILINPLTKEFGSIKKSQINCKIIYKTILFEPKEEFVDENGNFPISNHSGLNGEGRMENDPYYMVYHVLAYPKCKGFLAMPYSNGKLLFMLDSYNTPIDNFSKEDAKQSILDYCQGDDEMYNDAVEILSRVKDTAYEVLPAWPKDGSQFVDYSKFGCGNLVCLGDSVGSLNPIYGQGITMAIESALLFNRFMERNGNDLSAEKCKEFQSELNKAYFFPWFLCSTIDTRYEFTTVSKDLDWQRKVSPIACYLTSRLFSAARECQDATNNLFMVLFMEEGFRKKMFDPFWMIGMVFARPLLLFSIILILFIPLCVLMNNVTK